MSESQILTEAQRNEFRENGYIILRNFYNVQNEIRPIHEGIHKIIGLVNQRHGSPIVQKPFDGTNFDSGYNDLLRVNRAWGGDIYDAIKQIPAFLRLISGSKNERLFRELRNTDAPGIGTGSYGIRIDNPGEEKFRSHWHQEFLYQPQSLDGVVFWTPLVSLTKDLGPVMVCSKSHLDGLCMYERGGAYAEKSGAYQIGIYKADEVAKKYEVVQPLTEPGDLLLMDFLTIHQSGFNTSGRSRWSIQSRFFNFKEPTGMKIGWKAAVTAGTDVIDIFAENFVTDHVVEV